MTSPVNLSEPTSGSKPFEVIADADSDREAWLEARKTLITATDVPAILGIPQPGARLDLFYKKRDEIDRKRLPEFVREAGELGHILEPANASLFMEKSGRMARREQKLLRSKKYPWLGCTTDYSQHEYKVDLTERPLETKSTCAAGKWDDGHDPCMEWQVQVSTQCLVWDVSWGSLSVIFGFPAFSHRWTDIKLDDELAEMIVDETDHFAWLIENNKPPQWGDDVDTYEVLRRLDERRVVKNIIELEDDELVKIDAELQKVKARKSDNEAETKRLEAEVKALEAKLGTQIGENDGGRLPNGIVYTFKVIHIAERTQDAYHYRKLHRQKAAATPLRGTNDKPFRKRSKKR